ncbi:MAG: flagellar hook-length control protein FliK [Rhodocyclales bacterium]|nr:flagellar hook-length control protein FliK [Rhodocyclales bacterium]
MTQLNVAPNPTPVAVSNVDTASMRSGNGDAVAADGDSPALTPFAAILKHQIRQPANETAAKTVAALLTAAAAAPETGATQAETTAAADDAIAFLAPMLPGVAPQKAETEKKADTEEESDPVFIAAPTVAAVHAASLPQEGQKPEIVAAAAAAGPDASANLAAGSALATENVDSVGGARNAAQEGFDALLAASREASQSAANNSAAAQAGVRAPSVQAAASTQVETPVGAKGWNEEVGEKILWMANRRESHAELVLNPPQLGRIEVSLSMNGDQATAVFVSANPAVREALENAVPRLREIMQDAGISLGQTQVGAESFQQSANKRENGDNPAHGRGNTGDAGIALTNGLIGGGSSPAHWVRYGNGLVDTFA